MPIKNFKDFLEEDELEEALHPELTAIINSPTKSKIAKQKMLVDKMRDLMDRGEKTGVEGKMPKGSSRAFLKHDEPYDAIVDGKPVKLRTGTKVAIRSRLHKTHNCDNFDGLCLGALQNRAETGDRWVNQSYRILRKTNDEKASNYYETNVDSGIFPPLLDSDDDTYQWNIVSHVRDIKSGEFQKLTKTKDFPQGITHQQFVDSLIRFHNQNNGKYWKQSSEREKELDKVEQHPLVQKFIDYHGNTGNPPHDYMQIKNLGVFEHPNGSLYIIARDHGFDSQVSDAYSQARQKREPWQK
jgi:hypothetical protein